MASAKRKAPAKNARSQAPVSDGTATIAEGRVRAVIDAVLPIVDGGRFPAKRIAGEAVAVEAHCFTDGHDKIRVVLRWEMQGSANADYEIDMQPQANDVWTAEFTPSLPGRYQYTVMAWVDHFESWRRELERREDRGDILVASRPAPRSLMRRPRGRTTAMPPFSPSGPDSCSNSEGRDGRYRDSKKPWRSIAARAAIVARYADRSLGGHARAGTHR